ncbi:hypothetical protein L204_106003 [Cryptococcus depauperatus]
MFDLENELLDLAEENNSRHKKRHTSDDRGKRKSKAYIEDSDDEDVDMEIESEEDDEPELKPRARVPSKNPYPLEGKYVDEADREALENLPEIERENILASRLEEIQKYKDSQALDAMFKTIGGDEEDEDDIRARKKRKHTSVTEKASKALDVLKNKRKAKNEQMQRRQAARRSVRQSNSSLLTDEEGEIAGQSARRSTSYSPARSLSSSFEHPQPQISKEDEFDSLLPQRAELEAARISRYELVDMMHKDGFKDVVCDAYVRLLAAERDEQGRPKYRIHKVVHVDTSGQFGTYSIEYKGRQIRESRALLCKYGSASRLFRITDVSNGVIEEGEFRRFCMTNEADGIKPPKRSALKKKHEEIEALHERPMTNAEIDRRVESRKAQESAYVRSTTLKIHQLLNTRGLALRRNDHAMVKKLNSDITALGGDPQTGKIVGETEEVGDDYDMKIQKINENNKKKTKEAMMKAHTAAVARKKAEEAVIKAKLAASAQDSVTSTSSQVVTLAVPPASGQKKGETPQQYVARTVKLDLDLGDF